MSAESALPRIVKIQIGVALAATVVVIVAFLALGSLNSKIVEKQAELTKVNDYVSLLEAGDYDAAIVLWDDQPMAYLLRGLDRRLRNQDSLAVEDLETATRFAPNLYIGQLELALASAAVQDTARALRAVRALATIDARHTSDLFFINSGSPDYQRLTQVEGVRQAIHGY